jgi:hypothetical protein
MKRSQRAALDFLMSDYPEDASFEGVISLILAGDPNAVVWAPVDAIDPHDTVNTIEGLAALIEEVQVVTIVDFVNQTINNPPERN